MFKRTCLQPTTRRLEVPEGVQKVLPSAKDRGTQQGDRSSSNGGEECRDQRCGTPFHFCFRATEPLEEGETAARPGHELHAKNEGVPEGNDLEQEREAEPERPGAPEAPAAGGYDAVRSVSLFFRAFSIFTNRRGTLLAGETGPG